MSGLPAASTTANSSFEKVFLDYDNKDHSPTKESSFCNMSIWFGPTVELTGGELTGEFTEANNKTVMATVEIVDRKAGTAYYLTGHLDDGIAAMDLYCCPEKYPQGRGNSSSAVEPSNWSMRTQLDPHVVLDPLKDESSGEKAAGGQMGYTGGEEYTLDWMGDQLRRVQVIDETGVNQLLEDGTFSGQGAPMSRQVNAKFAVQRLPRLMEDLHVLERYGALADQAKEALQEFEKRIADVEQ
jgi:hypothetical protein